MEKDLQRTDCLCVLPDKTWWAVTAVESSCVPSEVIVHYRFQSKNTLNPNMVTLAETYHSKILIFPSDGGAFRSYRIGFIYADTKVDVSNLSKEEQLLFE